MVATAVVVLAVQAVLNRDDDDDVAVGPGTTAPGATTSIPSEPTDSAPTDASDTTVNRVHPGNFEDGLWSVGTEIQPGRYITTNLQTGCSWERLSGSSGGQSVIVAETDRVGQVVVDILPSDGAFRSLNCGVWEVYEPPAGPPATTIEDGDWVVGDHVEPATYSSQSATGCGWTHASGFEHTAQEVIATVPPLARGNELFTVALSAGQRFSTTSCGTWTKVG